MNKIYACSVVDSNDHFLYLRNFLTLGIGMDLTPDWVNSRFSK